MCAFSSRLNIQLLLNICISSLKNYENAVAPNTPWSVAYYRLLCTAIKPVQSFVMYLICRPSEDNACFYPELFFGALPPPLLFLLGAPPCPPTPGLLGLLTSLLPGLTFILFCGPPASLSAVASSSSGLVFEGSKAASECAAPSSEPDLAYSVDRGLSESLSCASFCANRTGVVETKRGRMTWARAMAARWTARVGWMRNMVKMGLWFGVGCFGERSARDVCDDFQGIN